MLINFLRRIIGRTSKQMGLLKVVTLMGLLLGVGYTICLGHDYSHDKNDHVVFGPKKFDRDRGKPEVEKVRFSVANGGTDYTLRLVNGDKDGDRDKDRDRDGDKGRDRDRDRDGNSDVSSAKISLNGVEVIGPSDFHHHVKVIERNVTLLKSNVLTVLLNGKPGSFITITINGTTTNLVNVPDVVGMTQANAQTAITSASLVVGTVTTESSCTVPAGSVISQSPVAGATVVQGSSVALVVSTGPPTSTVPNVVGMTQADAQAAITAANLVVGTVTTASSSTVPAGSVISQNPVAGATAAQGSTVSLVVSSGPTNVPVPNVVGMPQTDAQTAITAANLVVGAVTTASSSTVPAGTVIGQDPAAGASILAGSAIALTVSSGPPPLTVPDVTGLVQQAAKDALVAKGLNLGTVTSANSATAIVGTVISQNPAAATTAAPGTAVSVVLSLGPAANTNIVPRVIGLSQSNATAPITAAGLTVGVIGSDYSSSVPSGTIISQYPLPGNKVPAGSAVNLVVSIGPIDTPPVPPDPQTVAPPLDLSVATTVAASASFLYTGPDPIQTGVPAGAIELRRAAVVRGLVTDKDNLPLSGVNITIKDHPEFGQTYSRADGMFDMAVDGGGLLTVTYEKTGYLPAQRQVNAPWQDYAWLPVVVLIPVDTQVTTIDLASASQIQVHQGNAVTDADGTRQATLLFSPGTTAQLVMPNGSTQSLGSIKVRATEYTVGPNGPKTMPGQLPPASGYTYAVELSADEAIAAGAKQVTFSQPVYFYVDNFIGFPVGGPVPTGYYDRGIGQWIASQNGRVINILGITGGLADIDTNGDGLADDATTLATLGITQAEQQQLAALYPQTPKQLWRVPVSHFSPWDCNWPYGPPKDATSPNQPEPKSAPTPDPCEQGGSIIECQNQVLGERIGVPGTPFNLNYRSSRVPGHMTAYTVNIPVSGATVPASLKRIALIIQVAGRQFSQSLPATPNQSYTFTWDGKDAYGRTVQGKQPITVRIGYVYGVVYMQPSELDNSFGRFSDYGGTITGSRVDYEVTIWQTEQLSIGGSAFDARSQALGGWDLDIHHVYDPAGKVLLLGDGSRRSADSIGATIITTVAGNGVSGYSGDGGPATSASLYYPYGVAIGQDGSIYIADTQNNVIRRVAPDQIITTVAGGGAWSSSLGDGGPATSAALNNPSGVTVGPDGSVYIADQYNDRIRRVGPDGIITTVAGNYNNGYGGGYGGDGGPATSALLNEPKNVAVGPDGSIYIADYSN